MRLSCTTFPIDKITTTDHSQTTTAILATRQEMVSSSSTTNFGAQHQPRSSRSTVQHRQHPYIIPGRKSSTQKLRISILGTDTGVDGPLTADQRRFSGILEPSPLATPNIALSTQPTTPTSIPDLTGLITRCSPDPISGGTYGNIYKCIYHGREGDAEVAVKSIRPQFFNAETFRRELGIWKRLRHSNILKFMGTTSDFGPSVALVAPWMTNGTLTSFLDQNNETLRLHDRLLLLRDIAAGLNYLHTFSLTKDGHADLNPVVHGDLTGTNVLIDGDRKAYLADFGLSGTLKKLTGMTYLAKLTCHPGAVRWAAPELLSGEESTSVATTQSDMYSFGNIMLQVLTGNVPWCHLIRDFQISYQVVIEGKIHPRPNDVYVTDRHWNFMTRCWSLTSADRPPAKEAVQFVGSVLHTCTSPQSPTLLTSSGERTPSTSPQSPTLSTSSGERTLSTSPQSSTLSTSSDERHYLRGDTDARLPAIQDVDSPFAYFLDKDDNDIVTPFRYPLLHPINYNTVQHNGANLTMQQSSSLQHYMQHVLRIQYLHADESIDGLIWRLIHSSDSAREAACLLADLHRRSTQGAIGFTAPLYHGARIRIPVILVTEGDALASLCMVSYFLFSGGQGQWKAFLDSACEFSIKVLQRNHVAPDWALRSCSDSMRFIIKTSMWFDVLASATLIRRPKFLDVLRSLYDPATAVNDPELSMMDVMGCENRIVLALAEIADLAFWKDECMRACQLSILELLRRGRRIETLLKSTNDSDHLSSDTEKSRRRRLTSDVFRASALVYLCSVVFEDDPRCPEIMYNITETVKCLRRAEDVSAARHVVRSVVFGICICGCLTDDPHYREYFLRRLQEQQTETVGNCTRVAQLMKEVWSSRERGEPVDWRVVMQRSQMLLV